MTDLVRGEAIESDEEAESSAPKIFALEVSGEATESDEDLYEKDGSNDSTGRSCSETTFKNNILQRKLIENNIAIWKNFTAYIKSFIIPVSKQLLSTDQLLIRSQVSVQSVLTSLELVQTNVRQLHAKTSAVLTTNFIPKINLQQ